MEPLEHLPGGYTLDTKGAYPLGTDSMCLAAFAPLGKNWKVADLGSGSGALGLLLCAREKSCSVSGLELSDSAHAAALSNIARCGLSGRLSSLRGDIRDVKDLLPAGAFQLVVSNPPYFSKGHGLSSSDPARKQAREESCPLDCLFEAAAWCLPTGGRFCLSYRIAGLADLIWQARLHKLEPKRLCLVRHSAEKAPAFFLLECRRDGRPQLSLEELTLYGPDGRPTPQMREIYHL